MKPVRSLVAVGCLLSLAVVGRGALSQPDTPARLRQQLLQAEKPSEVAESYRALFEKVGRAGLAKLAQDEDTGLALQANWELHKKLVKRDKPVERRSDDIYD